MGEYTYKKEEKNSLVKEGKYEATIEKIEKKRFDSGAEKIQLTWRIRSDVEQQYKNKCLFEDIWRDKEDKTSYNKKRINQLLGTQEVEEGTTFSTDEGLIEFLTGKNAIINVVISFDNYKQTDINRISYYRSSEHKPQRLGQLGQDTSYNQVGSRFESPSINQSNNNDDYYDLSDDDLPF